MFLVSVVSCFVHPWMWDVHPDPLPVGRAEGVGGVDPAVGVEHVLGDVPGVHAHYGGAYVLSRGHYEGEGEERHDRDAVVEPKH